jgi:hypothetical protein
VRLAHDPKAGSWRGPLPRRRVTPPPILGDFLGKATTSSDKSATSSSNMATTSSVVSSSSSAPAAVAQKVVTAADLDRVGGVDHGIACEPKNRYGLGHLAHRFKSLWAPQKARVPAPGSLRGITTQPSPSSVSISPPGSSSPPPLLPILHRQDLLVPRRRSRLRQRQGRIAPSPPSRWSAPAIGGVAGGCCKTSCPCISCAARCSFPPSASFIGSGWWSARGDGTAVSRGVRCGCPASFAAALASVEAVGAAGVHAVPAAARVPICYAFSAGACVPVVSVRLCTSIWSGRGFVPTVA